MFLVQPSIFPWDLAIILLLAFTLSTTIVCVLWFRCTRHSRIPAKTAVGVIGFLSFLGFLLVTYGSFIEPNIIVVTEYAIPFPSKNPLTIVVFSDIQVGPYKGRAFTERAVRRVNDLLPDIVLIAGDFTFDDESNLDDLPPLQNLRASAGVFAALGNHESGKGRTLLGAPVDRADRRDELTAFLTQRGIHVLRNDHVLLSIGEEPLAIAGVEDVWTGKDDPQAALKDIPPDTPVILLSHNPDVILNADAQSAHLIVSGHTHGGQMRLPLLGPIPPIPTKLGRRYDQGIFPVDEDTTLAITRGLGETGARTRLFAWPEILLLKTTP